MSIDLSKVQDFVADADKAVGRYRSEFSLSPDLLQTDTFELTTLNWESVRYDESEINVVPDDKRGIYAFSISVDSNVLPPHGYILYIGIAGRKSNRSLRARYKDYFSTSKVLKRARIARMIGLWSEVLVFHYATIEDAITTQQLERLEEQLNGVFMPPMANGDLEAKLKEQRRAFS